MSLIADFLLVAGALGATLYCYVLSRRLAKFNDLERGVGGAVAVLSAQVDDMTKTLERAEVATTSSAMRLDGLTAGAVSAANRLELLVASMHDIPDISTSATIAPVNGSKPDAMPEKTEISFVRHPANVSEASQ